MGSRGGAVPGIGRMKVMFIGNESSMIAVESVGFREIWKAQQSRLQHHSAAQKVARNRIFGETGCVESMTWSVGHS